MFKSIRSVPQMFTHGLEISWQSL